LRLIGGNGNEVMTKREKELQAILEKFAPAAFDILWCALVWNDHNFSHDEFFKKAMRASKALGFDRGLGRGVEQANEFMERIDRALRVLDSSPKTGEKRG